MDDEIESLLVDVRASTEGFARDIATMRASVETDLVSGFTKAGDVLERGLAGAIRSGNLGFDDLKRVASETLSAIAAQAAQGLTSALGIGASGSPVDFGSILGSAFGLPGRATGGNVSPGRGYLVGERGPELFVPTSAGRVETGSAGQPAGRDVRVSINLVAPRGSSAPQSLHRSGRQVASAVRRALSRS